MASPALRSTSQNYNYSTTTTSFTATEPAGAASGDILIATVILAVGSSGFTPPSGWTLIDTRSVDGDFVRWAYWVRRGASAPALGFSWTGANNWEWGITCWSGCVASGNPIESFANNTVASTGTQPDAAAVTTATADTTVVVIGTSWRGFLAPSGAITGYTTAFNGNDGGNTQFAHAVAYKAVASAGSENPGAMSNSVGGSDSNEAITIVLASTAGAAPITSTVAGDITADFAAAVAVAQGEGSTIAGSITADFSAAVSITVGTPTITSTAAGSITADITARVVATHVPSSMALSTSGHHLVAGGQPKFLLLDAAWSIAVQLTRTQIDTYLDTRKAQGFDGVIWEMIESGTYGGPDSAEGAAPFLTPNDLTTPNPAYWDLVDYIQGALACFVNGYRKTLRRDACVWGEISR